MKIQEIIHSLEQWAPLDFQESYDNSGLISGNPNQACTGVLCSLDCTEEVVDEAIAKGCNLIVSHHPIIFKGVKQLTIKHFIGRTLIKAIRHNISLYAFHTNLDNVIDGVNKSLADQLQLTNRRILAPIAGKFDQHGQEIGAGIVGELPLETEAISFLQWVKEKFHLSVLKHTPIVNNQLKTIALCGGSGSFLIDTVKQQNIDCFITSDLKYHEFFEADNRFLLVDIGHGESEQYVPDLIIAYLNIKFPTFAVLRSLVNTQPVTYLK
jgi:dinuclear metal center YbgI/SA1388 family protein